MLQIKRYSLIAGLILCMMTHPLLAQDKPIGGTSPSVKWRTISTEHFKVVYQKGEDSLARVYARNLEFFRSDDNTHTVVLRDAFLKEGVVSLVAPRRTEVFTAHNPFNTIPTLQSTYLSIDAANAASYLKSTDRGFWHIAGYVFGDYSRMASLMLKNPPFDMYARSYMDENKYINGLRTDRASFLNYPFVLKDNGENRDYWRFVTGVRNGHNPDPSAIRYAELSGGLDNAFSKWKYLADSRRPYSDGKLIVDKPAKYTSYSAMTMSERGVIYAVKTSTDNIPHLVSISNSGEETVIGAVDGQMSRMSYDSRRESLFWSEWFPHARWYNQGHFNVVLRPWHGNVRKVEMDDIVNPQVSFNNASLLTVSSSDQGGILELDKVDGSVIRSIASPSGQRTLEVTDFEQGTIIISTVDEQGYSLWKYEEDSWTRVLGPIEYPITYITGLADCVFFISDIAGSDEVYRYVVSTGSLSRMTNTRYGVDSFVINAKEEYMVASINDPLGVLPYRFEFSDLALKKVDVASLGSSEKVQVADVSISSAQKFNDTAKLLIPSLWYPFYNGIDGLQFGATARSINTHGTSVITAGYSLQRDINDYSKLKNVAHIGWTFSKFAPVLSVNFDYGRSVAREWSIESIMADFSDIEYFRDSYYNFSSVSLSKPLWNLDVSLYLPLSFKLQSNIIDIKPRISARMNNDLVSDRHITYFYDYNDGQMVTVLNKLDHTMVNLQGHCVEFEPSFSASLMKKTPETSVFPKFGIGMTLGAVIPSNNIRTNASQYADIFVYLPGFASEHGLKLSTTFQHTSISATGYSIDAAKRILPKGFQRNTALFYALNKFADVSLLIGADYAIPVVRGGMNLSEGLLYVKRFVVQPHVDFASYLSHDDSVNLFTAGVTLNAEVGSIFRMISPFDFGVTISYNGGNAFKNSSRIFNRGQVKLNHIFVGPAVNYKF